MNLLQNTGKIRLGSKVWYSLKKGELQGYEVRHE